MIEHIANSINTLGKFCGKRDIPSLTKEELRKNYNMNQVDVMVLFGGSIICGGDVLAQAMINNIAKKYIIVGGAGHTTEILRLRMQSEFPEIETCGLTEAEIFANYLNYKYNLKPDLLECKSTNCGNNITYLLDLLKENNINFNSIILVQDSTMQLRMQAGMNKYIADDVTIINFAAYDANVIVKDGQLIFENDILGMWDMQRYITLLMGEIPRLTDNISGYGPLGANYIAHVEIPNEVDMAFSKLKDEYGAVVRKANKLYASKN